MRHVIMLVPMLCGVGCSCNPASTGWRFEVGRPGSITTPLPYQQTGGSIAVAPIGSASIEPYSVGYESTQFAQDTSAVEVAPAPRKARVNRRLISVPTSECTAQEMCDLLRRIDSRLNLPPAKSVSQELPRD